MDDMHKVSKHFKSITKQHPKRTKKIIHKDTTKSKSKDAEIEIEIEREIERESVCVCVCILQVVSFSCGRKLNNVISVHAHEIIRGVEWCNNTDMIMVRTGIAAIMTAIIIIIISIGIIIVIIGITHDVVTAIVFVSSLGLR